MNGVLQLAGFILSTIGYICVLITAFVPEWRRNDPSGDILQAIIYHQGIWIKCIAYPTGQWQCDDYNAFFIGLPGPLQAARGLSISAVVIGMLGFVISLLGMKCTSCMENNPRMKSRTSMIGAACFGISGLAIGIAVSYFAHQVLSEYNTSLLFPAEDIGQRFIYGACLFVGWAAMAILLLGCLIACCGSSVDDEEDSATRYVAAYNKGHKPNTEYV